MPKINVSRPRPVNIDPPNISAPRPVDIHISNMASQLSNGGGRPQGRRPRPHTERPPVTVDPGVDPNAIPSVGPQAFGTYAPGIDAKQFQKENFKRVGLKNSKLDGGMGLGGFGGGLGSMGMGMNPGLMAFLSEVFPAMMGQFEDNKPISGR